MTNGLGQRRCLAHSILQDTVKGDSRFQVDEEAQEENRYITSDYAEKQVAGILVQRRDKPGVTSRGYLAITETHAREAMPDAGGRVCTSSNLAVHGVQLFM